LNQQYETLHAERKREYEFVASWQNEKLRYEKYIKGMERAMTDNPFVMVLIDGDGMIVRSACAYSPKYWY
jgi:hypothetical protein